MTFNIKEYQQRTPRVTRSGDPDYVKPADSAELSLMKRLDSLLTDAHLLGYVITVDLESEAPLEMGKYRMIGHVRGMR